MADIKMGDPIWIPNPYPSAEPLDAHYVSLGPGLVDEDPKGLYRKTWCPVERSERPVFVPAVLSKVEDDGYVCSTVLEPSVSVKIEKTSNMFRRDVGSGDGYDDCLNVKHRNSAELLWNVQKRYTRDQIYTMCGSNVVISVNPYKSVIPGNSVGGSTPWRDLNAELIKADRTTQTKRVDIFDPAVQRVYASRNVSDLPPHIYSVASKAVDNVLRRKIKSQVIILSGRTYLFFSSSFSLYIQPHTRSSRFARLTRRHTTQFPDPEKQRHSRPFLITSLLQHQQQERVEFNPRTTPRTILI